jgi:CRISPR-associated endonuclease Csn1
MAPTNNMKRQYILGLDIGTSSIGWACIGTVKEKPDNVIASGVRRFDPGMEGTSQDFTKGKETSRAVERRKARQTRRQLRRKSLRRFNVFQILVSAGLLPDEGVKARNQLTPYFEKLDSTLAAKLGVNTDHVSAQLLTYKIRSNAVLGRVEPFELGRALYHLAKRRGFNSNLRGTAKSEDGEVRPAINTLNSKLAENKQTLGQYFASLNPTMAGSRIRQRWTGREMFLSEFDRIWEVQSKFHPALTESLRTRLRKAIFFQRPLRSAKGLVGRCSLEPKKKRLAAAHPLAQEVRMLQFINNLKVVMPGELDRQLNSSERNRALELLSNRGKMTLKQFKEGLELPKKSKLNFEDDDDTYARGLDSISKIRNLAPGLWERLNSTEQERLFYELLSFNKRDALLRRLKTYWKLESVMAEALADIELEQGYSAHSRLALSKLRDTLSSFSASEGRWPTYAEAKTIAGYGSGIERSTFDKLPPVREHLPNVNSPAVIRALTELRKVVNELVDRFGVPMRVNIELARDLKRSKKERKRLESQSKEQAKRRSSALSRVRQEFSGYQQKAGYDRGIEMVLLAEECNWHCPYTGEPIQGVKDLLGDNSRFDIEHIFPRRYLDDSFSNKTICLHHENRNIKKDRLPAEAYSDNPEKYKEIIERVKRFRGPLAQRKLERFLAKEVPADFSTRQLNETRYISVAAADYLGLLYGGRVDSAGRQRVFTLTGSLTSMLRGKWGLNQILGSLDEKNRADHRQHAVDAIVVACTNQKTVEHLQSAAADGWRVGAGRISSSIGHPWERFVDDARKSVLAVIVSHRQHQRLNGPLHADSNYSVVEEDGKTRAKIRIPLVNLTAKDIESDAIVDSAVRRIVQLAYQQLKSIHGAGKEPKDVFESVEYHPFIENRDGTKTPIHSVRVWVNAKPSQLKPGDKTRYVISTGGSNFCARILPVLNSSGEEVGWADEVISRIEARKSLKKDTTGMQEVFRLFPHEHVLMLDTNKKLEVFKIKSISAGDYEVRAHWDGRIGKEGRIRIRGGTLKKKGFRKVLISPSGLIIDPFSGEILTLPVMQSESTSIEELFG